MFMQYKGIWHGVSKVESPGPRTLKVETPEWTFTFRVKGDYRVSPKYDGPPLPEEWDEEPVSDVASVLSDQDVVKPKRLCRKLSAWSNEGSVDFEAVRSGMETDARFDVMQSLWDNLGMDVGVVLADDGMYDIRVGDPGVEEYVVKMDKLPGAEQIREMAVRAFGVIRRSAPVPENWTILEDRDDQVQE